MKCYNNDSLPPSCLELNNASVQQILGSLAPNCEYGAWSPINDAWLGAFYFHTVFFGIAFLLIGIACIVFLSKRHLAKRFKTKTFFAIDVSLCILGFSKFLFYVLDPYGIAGFCPPGLPCMISSRLLFSLAFPSLTAAYTLVFLTLWYSAKMKLGRACIQRWRIIIPLCFIHYLVAIVFEFVGAFGSPYYIIFLLIACEAFFTLWGLVVCSTFLIGGLRLLHSVQKSAFNSAIVSTDIVIRDERHLEDGTKVYTRSRSTMRLKPRQTHQRALRKIGIVTYCAAILGALYSLLGISHLVMLCLQLFGECDEDGLGQNSNLWLALKYLSGAIELLLTLLLLYSINDVMPLVLVTKNFIRLIFHCGHVSDTNKPCDTINNEIFQYKGSVQTICSRNSSPTQGKDTLTRSITKQHSSSDVFLQINGKGSSKPSPFKGRKNHTLPSNYHYKRNCGDGNKSNNGCVLTDDKTRDSKSSSESNGGCILVQKRDTITIAEPCHNNTTTNDTSSAAVKESSPC
uniref:Proline-rich transmembrane protein 3/4 domain-containing protein n=1 Tax=Amphimedon queenslandica TaxID=400682 RepID=A0A1X7UHT6_AMPQE